MIIFLIMLMIPIPFGLLAGSIANSKIRKRTASTLADEGLTEREVRRTKRIIFIVGLIVTLTVYIAGLLYTGVSLADSPDKFVHNIIPMFILFGPALTFIGILIGLLYWLGFNLNGKLDKLRTESSKRYKIVVIVMLAIAFIPAIIIWFFA